MQSSIMFRPDKSTIGLPRVAALVLQFRAFIDYNLNSKFRLG